MLLQIINKVFFCFVITFAINGQCQVNVNPSILLNSSDSTNRIISGIIINSDSTSLINASSVTNNIKFNTTTGFDTIRYNSPYIKIIEPGSSIYLINDTTTITNPKIKLSNGITYEIKLNASTSSNVIIQKGVVYELVYSGTFFIINNSSDDTCPAGFYHVNKYYCIEINERPANNYYAAMQTCGNLGGHICSVQEWYNACISAQSQLNQLNNNWEWVGSGSNHESWAAAMGSGSCSSMLEYSTFVNNTRNFRCCYLKK